MTRQGKLRTTQLAPNDNKSFSIGTTLMVDDWYERLGLSEIIGRHKNKCIERDALVCGMFVDQLGDNFSIKQASKWLNRKEVLGHYEIRRFEAETLYRGVETLGRNRERIIRELPTNRPHQVSSLCDLLTFVRR